MQIRDACEADIPRLREIYNHYVEHTHVTFDVSPLTLADRQRWFATFSTEGPYRLFVVEEAAGILGYASSAPFRPKPAYERSVETSIYLAPDASGRGVGRFLYASLVAALESEPGAHRAYGGVAIPNEASSALHRRCGFEPVATFDQVGFKFGRYWDVTWFERAL